MEKTVDIADGHQSRVRRWEQRAEVPLVVVALAFLAAYAWPILTPDLPTWDDRTCRLAQDAAWQIFAVD